MLLHPGRPPDGMDTGYPPRFRKLIPLSIFALVKQQLEERTFPSSAARRPLFKSRHDQPANRQAAVTLSLISFSATGRRSSAERWMATSASAAFIPSSSDPLENGVPEAIELRNSAIIKPNASA